MVENHEYNHIGWYILQETPSYFGKPNVIATFDSSSLNLLGNMYQRHEEQQSSIQIPAKVVENYRNYNKLESCFV